VQAYPTTELADACAAASAGYRPKAPARRRGFSLVETTLALGLVTFASVSILALLPTGLNVMRAAMDQTVEAQIVRSIAGQAVVAPFDQLTAQSPFYFNDEGMEVDVGEEVVYTVTLSRHDPRFPGSQAATAGLDESLAKLRIEIVEQRGDATSGRTNIHALHVANYGK